jgi:hypothetical protein
VLFIDPVCGCATSMMVVEEFFYTFNAVDRESIHN